MAKQKSQLHSVRFTWLLWLYTIMPVSAIAVLVDVTLLNFQLKELLPHSPQRLLLFAIFFGLPHIIASNTIMVSNKDYLKHFKRHILIATVLIATYIFLAKTVFSYDLAYFLFAAVTILHVLKQQFGLTRAIGRFSGRTFDLWMWSGVLAGITLYTAVFMFKRLTQEQLEFVILISCCLTAFYFVQGIRLSKQVKGIPFLYLWANNLLVPLSLVFYLLGYSFFTILMPRIVHDCTAFLIYYSHDINRAKEGSNSSFQKKLHNLLPNTPLTPIILLSVLAIGLAYILNPEHGLYLQLKTQTTVSPQAILIVLTLVKTYLELMHYYMEAITWKAGSPYRKYVKFSV